jgi:hypothetical protein
MELFAMTASVCRAKQMLDSRHPEAESAVELADLFCRGARRKVKQRFRELWQNDDALLNHVAAGVMKGEHVWLEEGRLPMFPEPDAFRTRSVRDGRKDEAEATEKAAVG